MTDNTNYDAIIVGGGPAGISAGIYTSRAKLKTLIAAKSAGSLEKAEKIENYYGFSNAIGGIDLVSEGRKQAEKFGAEISETEVFSISEIFENFENFEENLMFSVHTDNGEFTAKTVIIATGKQRKKPDILGLSDYEGRGVSYCAICDGAFYQNRRVAVLGSGKYAFCEADVLSAFTKNITIFTNGEEPQNNTSYKTERRKVAAVTGDKKRLSAIILEDGEEIAFDALFVALGTAGTFDFIKKLGLEAKDGFILTNSQTGATNIAGIFAAGDCAGGLLQIAKAVGEGAVAGNSAIEYVRAADAKKI